ncbi:hypothetical protein BH93_22055 [Rhodococcoides fascians A25f]|uniref:hypothetical protein n=1 Tax=Rhodococcoides fascians TaxID=1828 RepID=UPI0013FDEA0F|nr:hypothetical protein [Rhodococcus fascians]QII03960.1 hypothetical protein BH93_22055 [Rhodococcus fascians A25f]
MAAFTLEPEQQPDGKRHQEGLDVHPAHDSVTDRAVLERICRNTDREPLESATDPAAE